MLTLNKSVTHLCTHNQNKAIMVNRGYFIVVEGLEGAGKSTAIQFIKHHLASFVPNIILTREPGGTRLGDLVRGFIKESAAEEIIDPRSELLMLYAARIQLIKQIICPALEKGTWVLADRFELSTFAYQGGGRHLEKNRIADLSQFCLGNFKPDLIFFLDISPEQGLRRVAARGAPDRIEQESLSFFTDVYHSYHELIQTMDNVVCINAGQPLKAVQASIRDELERWLAENVKRGFGL